MTKFSKLRKYDITPERTARLTLHEIGGAPALDLLPSTEANRPYFNALLAAQRIGAGRNRVTASTVKEIRDRDRGLLAAHCLRGWESVVDDDGKPVALSKETAREFFDALPDDLFDTVRAFCNDLSNFRASGLDAEEAAKNS